LWQKYTLFLKLPNFGATFIRLATAPAYLSDICRKTVKLASLRALFDQTQKREHLFHKITKNPICETFYSIEWELAGNYP
jgi:hypothetical protein